MHNGNSPSNLGWFTFPERFYLSENLDRVIHMEWGGKHERNMKRYGYKSRRVRKEETGMEREKKVGI